MKRYTTLHFVAHIIKILNRPLLCNGHGCRALYGESSGREYAEQTRREVKCTYRHLTNGGTP